jgi:hypothetical protein
MLLGLHRGSKSIPLAKGDTMYDIEEEELYEEEEMSHRPTCRERAVYEDVRAVYGDRFFTESKEEREDRQNKEALLGCGVWILLLFIILVLMALL